MELNQSLACKKQIILNDNRNWYVAYTAPRAEKQVSHRLEMAGIEYYLPVRKEFRQWSDRMKQVLVPVFSSYIFVHVNQKEYYVAINQVGMVKYVNFGGVPAVINESTMEQIRKIVETNSGTEICDNLPSPGEKYQITSGPLKDIEGTVLRLKGKTHFFLEIREWGKYIMVPFKVN